MHNANTMIERIGVLPVAKDSTPQPQGVKYIIPFFMPRDFTTLLTIRKQS
jgi:hypothetical protein